MCKRLKKHLLNGSISVTSDSLDLKSDVTTEARGGGCGKRLNGKNPDCFHPLFFSRSHFIFCCLFFLTLMSSLINISGRKAALIAELSITVEMKEVEPV